MSEAVIISLSAIVKAHAQDGSGKRMISVEASNESSDSEGDVIEQGALLGSADAFLKSGHLDVDHMSELATRLGLGDGSRFIIGRPTEVKDLGEKRTGVVAELMRSANGTVDAKANLYDEVWESMQREPPVVWKASIYGFPSGEDGVVDCREETCTSKATRFHIKSLDWKSLALTRNPVNTSLKYPAKIMKASVRIDEIMKSWGEDAPVINMSEGPSVMPPPWMPMPSSLDHLWGQYDRHIRSCDATGGLNSRAAFKSHFLNCCACNEDQADILAHALMMMVVDRHKK